MFYIKDIEENLLKIFNIHDFILFVKFKKEFIIFLM